MSNPDFRTDFEALTGHAPFPWQEDLYRRFAGEDGRTIPQAVSIPTGLGKTNVIAVWLIALANEVAVPRRLVYCLPMRVLVEQTRDNASALRRSMNNVRRGMEDLKVYVLMGGEDEDEDDWDIQPERKAIIIGTQDMLLSRALNRGYAASRSRWPMQFGLLNTDCLWVFDEIQLMGSGLATTAQLEAFRRTLPFGDTESAKNGHGCRSVWMSATLNEKWLETVDFKSFLQKEPRLTFDFTRERADFDAQLKNPRLDDKSRGEIEKAKKTLEDRWSAKRPLSKAENAIDPKSSKLLAEEIVKKHCEAKGRTIVVVNTVRRARDLLAEIRKQLPAATDENLILVHSRFRLPDRKAQIKKMRAETPPEQLPAEGMIIVSTQVIEAGVDVSATTLLTELAPWASLVQRFGRCNRRGEQNEHASMWWIDVPDENAAPYDPEVLKWARETLTAIGKKPETERSVSLAALSELNVELPFEHTHVIRRRDLIDLFDTTSDLAGNDIDIDRFVREVEDSDVRVFWRDYGDPKKGATSNRIGGKDADDDDVRAEPSPRREELCPAPIGEFKKFAADDKRKGRIWRWNFLEEIWEKVDAEKITPGQVYLVHADAGGYSEQNGWDPKSTTCVQPINPSTSATGETPDATDDDRLSVAGVWQTIAEHTDHVHDEMKKILDSLRLTDEERAVLNVAGRWHDWGKAHHVFQAVLPVGAPRAGEFWAKARGHWKRYRDEGRPHFRHELASALALLQRPHPDLKKLRDHDLNLVAYLMAAHHGKVRLSIRSLPNEMRPDPVCGVSDGECTQRQKAGRSPLQRRFARGVWDGDELPETDLGQDSGGGRIIAPKVTLSMEPMELGLCEQPPFAGQQSWAERMIRLRDRLGPFRLAYLEAILRAADIRASKAAEQRAATGQPVGIVADAKEADHG